MSLMLLPLFVTALCTHATMHRAVQATALRGRLPPLRCRCADLTDRASPAECHSVAICALPTHAAHARPSCGTFTLDRLDRCIDSAAACSSPSWSPLNPTDGSDFGRFHCYAIRIGASMVQSYRWLRVCGAGPLSRKGDPILVVTGSAAGAQELSQ